MTRFIRSFLNFFSISHNEIVVVIYENVDCISAVVYVLTVLYSTCVLFHFHCLFISLYFVYR